MAPSVTAGAPTAFPELRVDRPHRQPGEDSHPWARATVDIRARGEIRFQAHVPAPSSRRCCRRARRPTPHRPFPLSLFRRSRAVSVRAERAGAHPQVLASAIATRQGGDVRPERGKRRTAPRAQRVRARPERSEGDAQSWQRRMNSDFTLRAGRLFRWHRHGSTCHSRASDRSARAAIFIERNHPFRRRHKILDGTVETASFTTRRVFQ